MRLFQVAALSLLLVTLPSNGSQQQKPPDSKQPSTQQSQSNPTITVSDNHYSATIQGNRAQEESKRWPPPWYSPFWPNWAFVFVGLGAAVAAVWTLFAIKDQASHMSNQVTLLDRQLAAFIEGQKSQLSADPHDNPAHDVLDPQGCRVQLEITNVGLVTAYDVLWESWIEVIVPPFIDFSVNADHFVSEEPFTLYSKHKPMNLNIPYRQGISDAERAMIRTHRLEVCVRVLVKWRDAFEPHKQRSFGYVVDAAGLRIIPKYHDSN